MEGHGVGKVWQKHETGYYPSDLLHALNECQTEIDKNDLRNSLYSLALDENTTRKKCVTAVMIRLCIFFLIFFC